MLRHIVMWRFPEMADGHTREENLKRVSEALLSLPPKIPEIRRFEVHRGAGIDAGASHLCLVSEFDDAAALGRYIVNPDHKAVSELVGRCRESRAVIDYIV